MITTFHQICRNFATENLQSYLFMIKNNYQQAAREYANQYMDFLLDMESVLGHHVEVRLNQLVEQKVEEYMKKRKQ